MSTAVKLIPETDLFKSIPLEVRLTQGVENLKELALRQRKSLNNKAANVTLGSVPEARFRKFSNSGELKMEFTRPMKMPNGADERIKLTAAENKRRLANGEAPAKALV